MDQRQLERTVNQYLMPMRIVALTFVTTIGVYVLTGWLLLTVFEMGPIIEELSMTVIIAVVAASLSASLISFPVRSSMLSGGVGMSDPALLVQRYMKANVVAFVLREVPAVTGLALTVLTGDITWVAALGAASVVTMALDWPRQDAVMDWLQQLRISG